MQVQITGAAEDGTVKCRYPNSSNYRNSSEEMNNQLIIERIDELIELGHRVLKTAHGKINRIGTNQMVDNELFFNYRTSCLSHIQKLYGKEHEYYKSFDENVYRPESWMTRTGQGILQAIQAEVKGGWLNNLQSLISSEIFSDFLGMAKHLVDNGYFVAAAVIAGVVLEKQLKELAERHDIETYMNGDTSKPKKASLLNEELVKANAYRQSIGKRVTSLLGVRNSAAHGKIEEISESQVRDMISGVELVLAATE